MYVGYNSFQSRKDYQCIKNFFLHYSTIYTFKRYNDILPIEVVSDKCRVVENGIIVDECRFVLIISRVTHFYTSVLLLLGLQ